VITNAVVAPVCVPTAVYTGLEVLAVPAIPLTMTAGEYITCPDACKSPPR
jgi:hypothetical protein